MSGSMTATSSPVFEVSSPLTDFTKCSSTTFSANAAEFVMPTFSVAAPEFVPNFMMNSQASEFTPYQANGEQHFSYGMAAGLAPQCASYNTSCLVCLDDYSDYSSDDEDLQAKPALLKDALKPSKSGVAEAVLGQQVANKMHDISEDECSTPTTTRSKFSHQSPSSDEYSSQTMEQNASSCPSTLESEASDKETESDQEGVTALVELNDIHEAKTAEHVRAQRFDISTLMKLRYSVDPFEGSEDRLAAMEPPSDETNSEPAPPTKKAPSKTSTSGYPPRRKQSGGERTKKSHQPRKSVGSGFDLERGEDSIRLTVSDGAYKAQPRKQASSPATDSLSDQDVLRAMKCILNKLTVEKFLPLFEKLVSCGIQTTFHLESLINEVFEKATTQHHFINMYADLCVLLHKHFMEHPISDDPKMSFKKVLLNSCQAFFERNLKPENGDSLPEEQREEFACMCKLRMLGNIKFVGALLVRQMLAGKVMFAIIDELLSDTTNECLESLACLLTIVGPTFDTDEWASRPMLIEVFSKVQELTKRQSICCRVRCLLKDVLELRACHWNDKKPKKIDGPSTLKEVADKQVAEEASQSGSGKSSQNGSRRSCKTSPCQPAYNGGGSKAWASRKPAVAPKPDSKTPYQRITSLAGLFGHRAEAKPEKAKVQMEKAERPCKQPDVEVFDQVEFRKEVAAALAELRASHEVSEAILRVSAIKIPSGRQPEELCDILGHASEDGCEASRKACFELVVGLFAGGHWKPSALNKGLLDFTEYMCADLQCDVPLLPEILHDELHPALAPLVQSGILQEARHNAVMSVF